MAEPAFPAGSTNFLNHFGTPTILWRVLNSLGYMEPPRYYWQEVEPAGTVQWYYVDMEIPRHEGRTVWCGWVIESDGQSPWEGAQCAALTALIDICQKHGDELAGGPTAVFPHVQPEEAQWSQAQGSVLVGGHGERAESSSAAMSAMMAVLKIYQSRDGSNSTIMAALREASDAQRKAKKRARKNGKELQEARHEVGQLIEALNTLRQQFVRAVHEGEHKHEQMIQLAREKEAL